MKQRSANRRRVRRRIFLLRRARHRPHESPHEQRPDVRFSRFIRQPDETPPQSADVPMRRWVMWGLIGAAIVVGIVLYFLYARLLQPLSS
jgi:hypothetical protein